MKLFKYLASGILIVITFIFIGEIYVWHIVNFETEFTYTTMYLQKNTTQQQMIIDIYDSAQKNNVEVFTRDKIINSLFSEKIIIYDTAITENELSKVANIFPGTYRSIFLGEVELDIKSLESIPDISKADTYYVIGNKDNIINFKQSLVNKYAGKYPQFTLNSFGDGYIVIAIWSVILLLFLILTHYEIAYMKKEVMIRIISGESIKNIIFKNAAIDFSVYLGLFILSLFVLGQYTNTSYYLYITFISILIFLLVNSILYSKLFFIDYKQDMTTKVGAKNVLRASYVFKIFSIVISIIIMSGCLELIYKGIDFYKQYNFFEEHSDYSYLTISSDDFDQTLLMNLKLYKRILDEKNSISLVNLGFWKYDNYLMADSGAIEYLKNKIMELKDLNLSNKVYFILPENDINRNEIKQEMKDVWESYYKGIYDYEIISYTNNVEIISIKNIGKIESTILKNPIIILNNMDPISLEQYWNIGYIANSTLYKFSSEDWNKFIKEIKYEDKIHYRTNAFDNYLYQWQFMKRNLYIGSVLLIILLLLETIIIKTILKYEFSVNAIELSLKKIYGYSLFNRHKKIFLTTSILGFICIVSASILYYLLKITLFRNVITGGIMIVVMEVEIIISYVNKLERFNVQKILKGGQI